MARKDGGETIRGTVVELKYDKKNPKQEDIEYFNLQLGRFADGKGGCHVAICYECYIDGLFHIN